MIEAVLRFVFIVLPMAMTTLVTMLRQPFSPFLQHGGGNVNAAFFIFGDSLLDAGNNDYLNISIKANHWPFGETFFHYPTGRVCDGRIPPDFIAEHAGLPFIKPYLQPNFTDYTDGANFASSGAGVLRQTSPDVLYLELQVSFFEEVTKRLKRQKGNNHVQKLISEAVYHIGIGGDDYMSFDNASMYSNTTISPVEKEVFVSWVIGNLTIYIKKVHELGGRKFFFQNVGPIGCLPSVRYDAGIDGCWKDANILAQMHNVALSRLLPELEKEMVGFKYVLFDYYTMLLERIFNNSEYGFQVGKSACCGSGAYNGKFSCGIKGEEFTLCPDPNVFVFFDSAHPTEAANKQLSWLMWNGEPPVTRPRNLKSLFEVPLD
ncbi:hypothetical protein MLD38_029523 [Melastoma candidum]|uniref:Uncharacterized protein n=1 Tax=Melastoma candidum TaxID=119954 RepID=A0ACB9N442_9MYRT|nr:hypothetical protein MLD38_029523 [Melastoma candidum]